MSESNSKWEIGVAVPVENYHFRYRNRFEGSGDLGSSSYDEMTSVSLTTDGGEDELENILDPSAFNEYVSIKNSSGKVTSKLISSVDDATTITLDSAVGSDFQENGITLFGYGKNMPGGWSGHSASNISKVKGDTDNFAVSISTDHSITQNINSDYDFSSNCNYRAIGVGKGGIKIDVTGSYDLTISGSSFTTSGAVITSSLDSDIAFGSNGGTLSDIGLEFAYNPDINKVIDSNGYYEFGDWPSQGSVEWSNRSKLKMIDKYNSGISLYDITGDGERNEKLTISASFTNAPISVYTTLREFERVQANGYSLLLHPYGYSELPKIIEGYMILENVSRSSWNLDLVDFDLTFKEK